MLNRESHKVEEEIEFLKRRNHELEELLNQQEKLLESLTLENTIKSKELEVRTELEKRLHKSVQN